jgi:ubiquinone/menaquinone biosynthesis C-methylase UbiE
MAEGSSGYLPALRFRALTPFFDIAARGIRERNFKPKLIEQARIGDGDDVLDLGCGTGTLAIQVKQSAPGARVTGLDGDPQILEQARSKSERAGLEIDYVEGLSTSLPFADRSFDRVLSTLFFHHLTTEDKRTTLGEIERVLRPGGELHVADIGRPSDPAMALAVLQVRAFDGFERTSANVEGRLPDLSEDAGLADVREHNSLRTVVGSVRLFSAAKPKRRLGRKVGRR